MRGIHSTMLCVLRGTKSSTVYGKGSTSQCLEEKAPMWRRLLPRKNKNYFLITTGVGGAAEAAATGLVNSASSNLGLTTTLSSTVLCVSR